ncbi:MAG: hypothetical protein JXR95_08530 [Deltaproteobacteria bacterium]|nr:hypothetical protein [Deltaproteobacteria bacterium]
MTRLILLISLFLFSCRCSGTGSEEKITPKRIEKKSTTQKRIITLKDVLKNTVIIKGYWKESDVFSDDEKNWVCSGIIISYSDKRLKIVSSMECTGIKTLLNADPVAGGPEVLDYSLKIVTPQGSEVLVNEITANKTTGTVILTTGKIKLVNQRDFELPPGFDEVEVGDNIFSVTAAVNGASSPTVTFGRVTATDNLLIQHDSPLSGISTGGGLYLKKNSQFYLVGINSNSVNNFKGSKIKGLNYSVKYTEISTGSVILSSSNPEGACKLIRGIFSKPCEVK